MSIGNTLRAHDACADAVAWVGDRSWESAWAECPRGDWLLWYAGRAGADRRDIVRAAAACARLVLHLVPPGEDRPRLAIEAAEAWADAPTPERAWAAARAAAAAEAWAAAAAARAAAAAEAWAAAAWTAEAAARAVGAAEAGAARKAMHLRCAEAVRAAIPFPGPLDGGAP